MILIVCVDDNYGMGFNHRRQSRDQVVTEEILKLSTDSKLWVSPYSVSLFPEDSVLSADGDFLEKAGEYDVCFAECTDVSPWLDRVKEIVLFRWNRKYPSDLKFPYAILKNEWKVVRSKEIPGHSHEKITMEVYRQ